MKETSSLEAIAKFLELMKVPIRVVFGVCVSAAIVLFAPDKFVGLLGLLQYREKYRFYFGIAVLLLIAIAISKIFVAVDEKLLYWRLGRLRRKILRELTDEEIQILSAYIARKTRTQYLSIQSGVVKGLVQDNIIYRSSNVNSPEYGPLVFAHNIQPWAWDYLNEHPELVYWSENEG
jgi:hypothetical protein